MDKLPYNIKTVLVANGFGSVHYTMVVMEATPLQWKDETSSVELSFVHKGIGSFPYVTLKSSFSESSLCTLGRAF